MPDINQVQLPDGSQYNIKDDVSGYATETYVQNQIGAITKATIGLGNVNNTSDTDKPVSTAQQTALDGKTNTSVIAYTESSATATKRYEIGDQFILNGVLYTATAIIANGGTITVGTNCSASDTIVEQIANAGSDSKADKTDLASISIEGSTNDTGSTIGIDTYFYLNGVLVRSLTDIANGATLTANTNYEVVTTGALNTIRRVYSAPFSGSATSAGQLPILGANSGKTIVGAKLSTYGQGVAGCFPYNFATGSGVVLHSLASGNVGYVGGGTASGTYYYVYD
jgi:hypothetical protein